MLKQQKIFFDFLRFCIGSAKEIPGSLKEADWKELYAIAQKQALLGVLFHGIQRLPKELAPEQKLLMQWMVMAEQIRKQNIRLFQDSVKVCQNFENKGFANCILKGQGNALLYPDPYMRTPGDIDIYLSGGRRKIMKYVDQVCPNQVMRYHHVDFPVMKTAIEVHFTPSYMFFPVHNSRMQKWFGKVMDLQCSNVITLSDGYGEIHVPQVAFNVIYILSHLYRHIFTEGIGLRQLLDYYFVICDFHKVYQNSSNHPVPLSKEGSTSHPSPLSSEERDVTALRCSEPLRSMVGGPSKVSPDCLCGVNRLGDGLGDRLGDGLGAIQVLVNVDIFSEGFDCPDVEFVQLARPTLSLAKYLQMVGRGLRVAKGKKNCVIIDNVGLYRVFGLPSQVWNWNAMFEGKLKVGKKKETAKERAFFLGSEEQEGHQDDSDSEMEMVVSHEELLQTLHYREFVDSRGEFAIIKLPDGKMTVEIRYL